MVIANQYGPEEASMWKGQREELVGKIGSRTSARPKHGRKEGSEDPQSPREESPEKAIRVLKNR